MTEKPTDGEQRGASEALRDAIERTFASTAGSAADTRERAGELLDEVSKRGQDAREAVSKRGQDARDAVGDAAGRVVEAIQGMRLATRDDLDSLREEIRALRDRVAELEQRRK